MGFKEKFAWCWVVAVQHSFFLIAGCMNGSKVRDVTSSIAFGSAEIWPREWTANSKRGDERFSSFRWMGLNGTSGKDDQDVPD